MQIIFFVEKITYVANRNPCNNLLDLAVTPTNIDPKTAPTTVQLLGSIEERRHLHTSDS